jgi:hypothetical protein
MVHRLEEARELFFGTDKKLEAAIQPFAERYGITPDFIAASLVEMKLEARGATRTK